MTEQARRMHVLTISTGLLYIKRYTEIAERLLCLAEKVLANCEGATIQVRMQAW